MIPDRAPQAVVLGGPNGAGKSSAARDLLRDAVGIDAFINADVIAEGLAGFDPDSVAMAAGRVLLRRVHALAEARSDLAFESTLAGRAHHRLLETLRDAGYHVHIFYLWLPSADLAVERVRQRVAAGGHDVPEIVIRRRFARSVANFNALYRPVSTSWRAYNASEVTGPALIAYGTGASGITILDPTAWKQIESISKERAP